MKDQINTTTSIRAGTRVLAVAALAAAFLSSCESSKPAPYIYVAPQKNIDTTPKPKVVPVKPKPGPSPAAAAAARRFSLEERERLEPVQAGGTGETLKTGIITTN